VISMDVVTQTQLTVLAAMATVITIKILGLWMASWPMKGRTPLDPRYAVSGFLGLLTAFTAYRSQIAPGYPIDVFVEAAVWALAFNFSYDLPAKFKKKKDV